MVQAAQNDFKPTNCSGSVARNLIERLESLQVRHFGHNWNLSSGPTQTSRLLRIPYPSAKPSVQTRRANSTSIMDRLGIRGAKFTLRHVCRPC